MMSGLACAQPAHIFPSSPWKDFQEVLRVGNTIPFPRFVVSSTNLLMQQKLLGNMTKSIAAYIYCSLITRADFNWMP